MPKRRILGPPRLPTQIYKHKVSPRAGKQPAKIKQAAKVRVNLASWPSDPNSFPITSGSIQTAAKFLDDDDDCADDNNNDNNDLFEL